MNDKINELYNKLDAQDEIIEQQVAIISEQKKKIDKTIDFIDNWKKYKKDKGKLEVSMLDLLYIKEILGDKENE